MPLTSSQLLLFAVSLAVTAAATAAANAFAVTVAMLLLPLLRCSHTTVAAATLLSLSLPPFFYFLIVDCFLPLPQLFAFATATTMVPAVFVGLPTRPQRRESVRDMLFANRTKSSLSSLSLSSLLLPCSASETLYCHGREGGEAVLVEGNG
jgi:hypothetical protein